MTVQKRADMQIQSVTQVFTVAARTERGMDPRHSPFASLTHEVEDDDKGERHSLISFVRRLPYAIALPLWGEIG